METVQLTGVHVCTIVVNYSALSSNDRFRFVAVRLNTVSSIEHRVRYHASIVSPKRTNRKSLSSSRYVCINTFKDSWKGSGES